MVTDFLDGSLLDTVFNEGTGDGSVNLELFAKNGSRDGEHFGHLLRNLFVALLVKEHLVVKLISDLDLGPTLLFSLSTFLGSLGILGCGLPFVSSRRLFFFRLKHD